jgi:hypothetical protein
MVRKESMLNPSDERLRPHPSTRLSGPVVPLNLPDLARALQAEPHETKHGHRQASLVHRGPLRLVLFAFEPGGQLSQHRRRVRWSSTVSGASWWLTPPVLLIGSTGERPWFSILMFRTGWRRSPNARCC